MISFKIDTKLILLFMLFGLIMNSINSLYFFYQGRRLLLSEFDSRARILSQGLAKSTEYPILFMDRVAIERQAKEYLRERDITLCQIRDKYNQILFQAGKEDKKQSKGISVPVITQRVKGIESEDLIIGLSRVETERIGSVYLAFSLKNLRKGIEGIARRAMLIVLFSIIAVSIVIVLLVRSLLTRPINHLLAGLRTIAQGKLGYQVDITSLDEIGDLAASFNQMSRSLESSRAEIVTYQEHLETMVSERTAELTKAYEQIKASLEEKEVMLQEIHHRVKNNLQVVSSLLNLQAGLVKDKQFLEIFRDSQSRIQSMALIHERLYRSKDMVNIDFSEYIRGLTNELFRSYGPKLEGVKLRIEAEDVFLTIDTAIPCGLIINELVSNSIKYAFAPGVGGEICIWMTESDNRVALKVSDNGVGIPADVDLANPGSLGWQLVRLLTNQLEGSLVVEREKGTTVSVEFKRG